MKYSAMRFSSPLLIILAILFASAASANHSVLVEGQSDFDGDGMIGMDEDNDGDQVFGTITRALGGAPGISQNGRITIVTSGRFLEQVIITAGGVVVLEAAPGVEAIIEAFGGANPDSANRQQAPGVIVDSNGNFPVIIRNIVSRNWSVGFLVMNKSNVQLSNVRADSNVDYGINVVGEANAVITDSEVIGTGFRNSGNPGLDSPAEIDPMPGIGIAFEDKAAGKVTGTTVAHSFAQGITGKKKRVKTSDNTLFNNKDKDHRDDDDDDDDD